LRAAGFNGYRAPFQIWIRDQEAYNTWWHAIFPDQEKPAVNFEIANVIMIGLESFPTSGHTMSLDCLHPTQREGCLGLIARITHTAPGDNCPVESDHRCRLPAL
ncbi:MAG: hypothetical protein ABI743_06055, partial [bacterium]